MRFQHNYGNFSYLLKLLSLLAILTLACTLWRFKVFNPLYYELTQGDLIPNFLTVEWGVIIFFSCVAAAGIYDKPRILYFFPFIAYPYLVSNICTLISYHQFVYDLRLPGTVYSFMYSSTTIIGLITLFFWHRKHISHRSPTAPHRLSKHMRTNFYILALLTYIVLVLDTMLFYEELPFYLKQMDGSTLLALNYGGINNLIFWGIILISSIKKWPYALWLFPLIAYNYLWPYLKVLVLNPDSMSLSLKALAFSATALVLFGLYSLIVWILENAQRR